VLRWIISIVLIFFAFVTATSLYLQPNDFVGCGNRPTGKGRCVAADAIVGISGGDTRARTESAIQLWKNGWGTYLIFSGAAQDKSGPSNAEAMEHQAVSEGVPAGVIHLEEYASSTEQNAENTDAIFDKLGAHTVILTTSGYHQRRAELEFKKYDSDVKILNHPVLSDSDWSFWWWLTGHGWWLAIGELVKVALFYVTGVTS